MTETKSSMLSSYLLRFLVYLAAFLTSATLLFIVGYILVKGIPHLTPELFERTYTPDNQSLYPALINTAVLMVVALLMAVPIGIFSAVYVIEYAKRGNKFLELVRHMTETLAGIPSIVFGLFGMLFFLKFLGFGYSILAGACTISIMILPLIMRTTEEALKSVPDSFREGSFALGAGKLRTITKIVLPSAVNGIFAGVILGIGRIVGETAALLFTMGTITGMAKGLMESGRTLALHMFVQSNEALHMNQCYATAVVLIVLAIGINLLAGLIGKRLSTEM